MRIGIMVGPETRRYAAKVDQMVGDAEAAEAAGFATAWIPQLPQDFDALTAAALMGRETTRIELATAKSREQDRRGIEPRRAMWSPVPSSSASSSPLRFRCSLTG